MPAPMPAGVTLFRALLIASVALAIAGGFIDIVFSALIPPPLAQALEDLPAPPMPALVIAAILFVITFGGTITAIAGLYFFQPWSRRLAVAMTLLGLLFHPLLGASVYSGWARLLLDLSSVLWGVVIAMSYVSSLSVRFGDS